MKYILLEKANYKHIESDYTLVDVFDSREEAEAQKDLWERIKVKTNHDYFIFEEVSDE